MRFGTVNIALDWFGLKILKKFSIENITILLGEREVVILCNELSGSRNYLNFYSAILYFSKEKIEIKEIFGLFTDFGVDLVRKKTRKDFFNNLNHSNIINLLEGDNLQAYYNNNKSYENLLGLEIRLEGNNKFLEEKEDLLMKLAREIGIQKSIHLGKFV